MDATKKIIMAAILLFIGLGLLSSISSTTADKTQLFEANMSLNMNDYWGSTVSAAEGQINETVANFTVSPIGGTDSNCPIGNVLLENGSGIVFSSGTEFEYNAEAGRVGLFNLSTFNDTYIGTNYTNLSYTYCKEDYVRLGWAKIVLNTIPGFFALALMLISVAIFYSVYQDYKKRT